MDSDPVEDGSPPRKRIFSHEDDPIEISSSPGPRHETIATIPLEFRRLDTPSPLLVPIDLTQPKEIIDHSFDSAPPKISDILVPRTSPAPEPGAKSSSPSPVVSIMAPPGTMLRPPMFGTSQSTSLRPNPPESQDDNITFDISDDDLEVIGPSRSNIPKSTIRKGPFNRKRHGGDVRQFLQSAPSRALPIGSGNPTTMQTSLGLDSNTNSSLCRLRDVFPNSNQADLIIALRENGHNFQAARSALAAAEEKSTLEETGLRSVKLHLLDGSNKGVAQVLKSPPGKPKNKRTVEVKKSLFDKYGFKGTQQDQGSQHPPKRRRLYQRPRKQPQIISSIEISSDSDSSTSKAVSTARKGAPNQEPAKKKIELIHDLSDPDVSEASYESDKVDAEEQDKLLVFSNECTLEQLVDLAGCTKDDANFLLSKRPFKNLSQIRAVEITSISKNKRSVKRQVGERIMDCAQEMWAAYSTVDRLLQRCQTRGQTLTKAINNWGVDFNRVSSTGELSLTTFNAPKPVDSAIGSDCSSDATPNGKKGRDFLMKQPSIMSQDITMKDYQVVGLNWLYLLYTKRMGGILADDMGLGKTCQVISLLSLLKEKGEKGPHIIVVPASTLENWAREFQKFSPSIEIAMYHGSAQQRAEMRWALRDTDVDVVITSYNVLVNRTDSFALKEMRPTTCIFDEAHKLKNTATKTFQNCQFLSEKSKWRLLLTGTPLQNNLSELMSLLYFILPDLFLYSRRDVEKVFSIKVKTSDSDHSSLLSAQRVSRAREMLTPFVLRRRKEQVISLPPKTSMVISCDMTERQAGLYKEYTDYHQELLRQRRAGLISASESVNTLMQRRQAAIHPLLLRSIFTDENIEQIYKGIPRKGKWRGKQDITVKETVLTYSDWMVHQLCGEHPGLQSWCLTEEVWMDSGKIKVLVSLLDDYIKDDHKVLLFSQFTSVLDILESVLTTRDIDFCRMDGSTPVEERQELIDQFQEIRELRVFMLSTRSGGAGINLACADRVIIFDASFNPQDDIQAENRAHRVGQTRPVEVVRLVTKGTVEEQIHALGKSKLALDRMVAGDQDGAKVGQDVVEKMLLGEVADGGSLKDGIIEEAKEVVEEVLEDLVEKGKAIPNGQGVVEATSKTNEHHNERPGRRAASTQKKSLGESREPNDIDSDGLHDDDYQASSSEEEIIKKPKSRAARKPR